jgi:hypothetical protein
LGIFICLPSLGPKREVKMKMSFILVIVFTFSGNIYAQDNDNLTLNLLYNITVFEDIDDPGASALTSLLTSSISAGIGYHLNVIPNIFSPGIYIEGGLSIINLIFLLSKISENDRDTNNNKASTEYNYDKRINAFGFLGIRLYNQFRFHLIDIQPFIGFSAFAFIIDNATTGVVCIKFGVLFAYKNFCIEYGYHIPYNSIKPIHRIGIGLHYR